MSAQEQQSQLIQSTPVNGLVKNSVTALVARGLTELRKRESSQDLWSRGRELVSRDQFDEAVACFESASALSPEDAHSQWITTFILDAVKPRKTDQAALGWYRIGAEKGVPWAQCRLAAAYYNGALLAQDFKQAASWYSRAAAQGFCEAQVAMGHMTQNGIGVSADVNAAVCWYLEAATHEDDTYSTLAQLALGDIYTVLLHEGRPSAEGSFWYEKALTRFAEWANDGWAPALYQLGHMYFWGKGVERSISKAVLFYSRAADAGVEEAREALDELKQLLNDATASRSLLK